MMTGRTSRSVISKRKAFTVLYSGGRYTSHIQQDHIAGARFIVYLNGPASSFFEGCRLYGSGYAILSPRCLLFQLNRQPQASVITRPRTKCRLVVYFLAAYGSPGVFKKAHLFKGMVCVQANGLACRQRLPFWKRRPLPDRCPLH